MEAIGAAYRSCGWDITPLDPYKELLKPKESEMEITDFAWAMRKLLAGKNLVRAGWNGNGMCVKVQHHTEDSKMTHPYLYMTIPECYEGTRLLPWQPAQVDLFANDWELI